MPIAAGAAGETAVICPIRFRRAIEGPPSYYSPDLDERGFASSTSEADYRPAAGPTVGMMLGGPDIKVSVVREAIGPKHVLCVKVEKIWGTGTLEVVSPLTSLDKPAEGYAVDDICLRNPFTTTSATDKDQSLAEAAAENERLLCSALWQYEAKFRKRLKKNPSDGTAAQAMTQIASLYNAYDHQHRLDAGTIKSIVESKTPLTARVTALKTAIQRRRAAAAVTKTSGFKVSVHLGSQDGPVLGELGVVLFPLAVIPVQPHVVSLGSTTDLSSSPADAFAADFSKSGSSFDVARMLLLFAMINVNVATAGLFFEFDREKVSRFRLCDATETRTLDGIKQAKISGYNDLFFQGFLLVNASLGSMRSDPWVNVLMNCKTSEAIDPYQTGKLNIYFVRELREDALKSSALVAVGFGSKIQTQTAKTLTVKLPPKTYNLPVGDDRIGIVCGVSNIDGVVPEVFMATRVMSRTLTHEAAHVCNVAHYRGGEGNTAHHDVWAVRNLMHLQEDLRYEWPSAGYGKVDAHGLDQAVAGVLLTMKKFPDPPATSEYVPRNDQVAQMREVFVTTKKYYGTGVK
ncbi:MAG: hypothetical protein U0271_34275 [Polyangiaceae bacterium]